MAKSNDGSAEDVSIHDKARGEPHKTAERSGKNQLSQRVCNREKQRPGQRLRRPLRGEVKRELSQIILE